VNDESAELRQLREELQAVDEEINELWDAQTARWSFRLGPFKVGARKVQPMFIAQVFVVFNILCFAAGVGLAFVGGVFTAIGASIIVGALFSFGSFTTQFWAVAVQDNRDLARRAAGEDDLARMRKLTRRGDKLFRQINDLNQLDSGENPET
jgi:hypothetical protein